MRAYGLIPSQLFSFVILEKVFFGGGLVWLLVLLFDLRNLHILHKC